MHLVSRRQIVARLLSGRSHRFRLETNKRSKHVAKKAVKDCGERFAFAQCFRSTTKTLFCSEIRVPLAKVQGNVRFHCTTESECELSEAEYHDLADGFLEALEPALEELPGFEDYDVVYSQGVLTLDLGTYGTWVLNKQTPNRQIWWSSPLSGPKRYYYNRREATWKNTRDEHRLVDLLNDELRSIFGVNLQL